MVIFVMFKWYKLLHYKEIPHIYWMTHVVLLIQVDMQNMIIYILYNNIQLLTYVEVDMECY